jgi:tripartite-type tricarboxylate transporter receptor subunit TctC
MYVAYAAGGTTDLTARALAQNAEKILGVPVVVENKAGGGSTVANALTATKKPDGYTVLVTSTGSLTMRPLLMKVAYTPESFRPLIQYTNYVGSLVVNTDAPWKNINEFVDHAKKHPGMSYSSAGTHTQQQVAVETLAQCKGLKFKHVTTKGGSASNTMLMGKHVDFAAGSGSHLPLLEQGVFRELLIFHRDERHPKYPDTPIMKDIDCPPSNPASGLIVLAPAGLPGDVADKLSSAFKQAAEEKSFQELLLKFNMPYDYKSGAEIVKQIPPEVEWYKDYLSKAGVEMVK